MDLGVEVICFIRDPRDAGRVGNDRGIFHEFSSGGSGVKHYLKLLETKKLGFEGFKNYVDAKHVSQFWQQNLEQTDEPLELLPAKNIASPGTSLSEQSVDQLRKTIQLELFKLFEPHAAVERGKHLFQKVPSQPWVGENRWLTKRGLQFFFNDTEVTYGDLSHCHGRRSPAPPRQKLEQVAQALREGKISIGKAQEDIPSNTQDSGYASQNPGANQ